MSRIGNAPITVPEGVEVNISAENQVHVKGKLGELTQEVNPLIKIALENNTITLSRPNDEKETRSLHGLLLFWQKERQLFTMLLVNHIYNSFVNSLTKWEVKSQVF